MNGDTLQKKVDMIEKIFDQTKDRKLRHALLGEVVSSRVEQRSTKVEPIKVKPYCANILHKNRLDIRKTGRPVSKIRKFILALLLPIEIICEIMLNRPWLSLFTIFGVILFIGKFVSANVAMGMAFLMLLTFGLMGRGETEEKPASIIDDDQLPIYPGSPYRWYYPGLDHE